MRRVYLDHNATTPVHPEVLEAMMPFFRDQFGNASSIHWAGREVKKYLDEAREKVSALMNADPQEIIFTGCGTESDNMAIKGVASTHQDKGRHIITSKVEHHAVLHTCQFMEGLGYEITYLSVDREGLIDPGELRRSIRPDTILVTIIFANNETGTIMPVQEIGEICRGKGVLFHTDAVQAVGKIPIDLKTLPVDILSLSGHKLNTPKGIGAQFIRKGTRLSPLIHGGAQEHHRRAGTENIPYIIGLGKACEIARRDFARRHEVLQGLRDRLQEGIFRKIPHVELNGHPTQRLPNTLNVSFLYVEGESLLLNMDLEGIAVSSGSACTSGSPDASHVILAMGKSALVAQSAIRFSLGWTNTGEDVDYVLEVLPPILERLRSISPIYQKATQSKT
ncbi:MAG: cysteine desulfurase [Deltaproteobacteria bacterium SM23_61]|nr:MAG: cysteine desulfurase [Deltaproteobacteria bacterium SM23_61]